MDLSTTGKIAAGAAGAASGGTFSYLLFKEMNVAKLVEQGTTYALTVFAAVALIVIFAGFAALPNKENDLLKRSMVGLLLLLGTMTAFGFGERMYQDLQSSEIQISAKFSPDLHVLNEKFAKADPAHTLVVNLDDGNGHVVSLESGYSSLSVHNGAFVRLEMDNLRALLEDKAVLTAGAKVCGTENCALRAQD